MVIMLFVLSYSVLRPLAELGHAADLIGIGQYDSPPLEVRSNDEISCVARSFNLMRAEIRRTIQTLEKQSEMEKHLLEKEVEAEQMQRRLQEGPPCVLRSLFTPLWNWRRRRSGTPGPAGIPRRSSGSIRMREAPS